MMAMHHHVLLPVQYSPAPLGHDQDSVFEVRGVAVTNDMIPLFVKFSTRLIEFQYYVAYFAQTLDYRH